MAMQSKTWSLSGLEAELGIDRRTLAKRLKHVPAAVTKHYKHRTEKRWLLKDVLHAVSDDKVETNISRRNAIRDFSQEKLLYFVYWLNELWLPAWKEEAEEIGIEKTKIIELYKRQFALNCFFLIEFITQDVFWELLKTQEDIDIDDLMSAICNERIQSFPPSSEDISIQMPETHLSLYNEDEQVLLINEKSNA